jgi:hypothetical protein
MKAPSETIATAAAVYRAALDNTSSFLNGDENIAVALGYLLGAIGNTVQIDVALSVDDDAAGWLALVSILLQCFERGHAAWDYIEFIDFGDADRPEQRWGAREWLTSALGDGAPAR